METSQLLGLAIAAYLIVRQFQERPVSPTSLLISPVLTTAYTCVSIGVEVTRPIVSMTWLLVLMGAGLLAGGLIGTYRGSMATIRFHPTRRRVTVKASTLNIILYLSIMAIRIAVDVLLALHVNRYSAVMALVIAFLTTLFLTNIIFEKVNWYQRARNYRAVLRERNAQLSQQVD